jgi:hypothetical protein
VPGLARSHDMIPQASFYRAFVELTYIGLFFVVRSCTGDTRRSDVENRNE